jgi:hypothetical protein
MAFVQPIEKDRSQVSFLGCHEGLPSLICNVACSRDGDDGIAQRVASEIVVRSLSSGVMKAFHH